MTPLSEQLDELADRAKQAEDFVAVIRAKNRAALDAQRELLKYSVGEGRARAEAVATAAQSKVQSWWNDTRSAVDEKFAALRAGWTSVTLTMTSNRPNATLRTPSRTRCTPCSSPSSCWIRPNTLWQTQ